MNTDDLTYDRHGNMVPKATDYARQTIFTQADVMFASILGHKFGPLTVLDIIRSISDLEIIEHPYDAINVAKVHERLQKNGYDANEVQDVIWALRERADGISRNSDLLARRQASIGDKPLTRYEREILGEADPR